MPVTREQTSQPRMLPSTTNSLRLLSTTTIPRLRRPASKRLVPRRLGRVLLPLVHLLPELLGLLLIREAQPEHALLALEGVEEGAVLVVLEGVVDLLVPQHPAVGGGHVNELDPEGVADEVVSEHRGAVEARVRPSLPAGEGEVEFGDGDGVDLVRRFGDGALDDLLLVVGKYGRHLVGECSSKASVGMDTVVVVPTLGRRQAYSKAPAMLALLNQCCRLTQ